MRFQGIAPFLFAVASILLAAIAVVLSLIFLARLAHFEGLRRRHARPRSNFVKKLLRGLARKRIRDLVDVHNAYRAFFGVDILKGSHLEEIAELLEGAMLLAGSTPPGRLRGWSQSSTNTVRELLLANQRALAVELGRVPFSGTPETERRILKELLGLAVVDNGAAATKMQALARAIRIRQDSVERLSGERGRCLRWAQWGWYGTLAFAVLSAILGVMYLGW